MFYNHVKRNIKARCFSYRNEAFFIENNALAMAGGDEKRQEMTAVFPLFSRTVSYPISILIMTVPKLENH